MRDSWMGRGLAEPESPSAVEKARPREAFSPSNTHAQGRWFVFTRVTVSCGGKKVRNIFYSHSMLFVVNEE